MTTEAPTSSSLYIDSFKVKSLRRLKRSWSRELAQEVIILYTLVTGMVGTSMGRRADLEALQRMQKKAMNFIEVSIHVRGSTGNAGEA